MARKEKVCIEKKNLSKELAARAKLGLIVMDREECDWVGQATDCTIAALEKQLNVEVIRVCDTGVYYCIISPQDPLSVYSGAYEKGVRDRVEIEGTRSFGLGPGIRCK